MLKCDVSMRNCRDNYVEVLIVTIKLNVDKLMHWGLVILSEATILRGSS
jgi:hypothetical protein